jgi:hypothetical protein
VHVTPPTRTAPRSWLGPWLLALLVAALALPGRAHAQITDTTAAPAPDTTVTPVVVPPPAQRRDTLAPPTILIPTERPISPGRAFVRSLMLPGSGQVAMRRTVAAGVYAFVEFAAIGMARKSALDLRQARRAPVDSTVVRYERNPATGELVLDPETGQPVPAEFIISDVGGRVRARKQHLEDWIALLIFNHLFSAADAYVAAHLWDFPATVGATIAPGREARVSASLAW